MLMEVLLLFLLKFLMIICFILHWLATMSPLGRHPPHLVDNTDTQYLGDQYWQQCWCFSLFFFFVSICLSMCQSVCVSVHLFTVTVNFLNVSLVSGLEFKKCRLLIKMLRTLPKIIGEVLVTGLGRRQPFQQLKFLLLL